MFSLPQAVGTLDELPDDLRRGKFDTVALRGVVFIGDREFDLVKPNVLVRSARLLRAEADCGIGRFVAVRTVNNLVRVLLLSKQGGKISRKKIVHVQRDFSGYEFFYNFVRAVVGVKDRFGDFNGKLRRNSFRHTHGRSVFLRAGRADRDGCAVKIAQTDCCHVSYLHILDFNGNVVISRVLFVCFRVYRDRVEPRRLQCCFQALKNVDVIRF